MIPKVRKILVVEDSRADVFLIREALAEAGVKADVHVVRDGEEAVHFLDAVDAAQSAVCPDLVLLDLNLPRKTGADVFRHLLRSKTCSDAPVVIMTSSDSASDRESMAALGAREYFHKPSEYSDFMKLGKIVRDLLEGR